MKNFKKIAGIALAGVMVLSLAACGQNANTVPDTQTAKYESLNTQKYLDEVKNMDEADFITYAQSFAASAKPTKILYDVVDSKIEGISAENKEILRQAEWVSIIYNIAKYQDLLTVYSNGLVYNDDSSLNYEATVANVGDGVFEEIYKNIIDSDLKVMERNDALYITTNVPNFIERAGNDINDAFKGYLSVVNEIDNHHFLKDEKVNYDNLAHCMIFSDEFLKTHNNDQIWETVYQQFYYQGMMYVGLYELGGFMNEDGSYNPDFETIVQKHIDENPDTLFAKIMTCVLEKVKIQKDGEWNYDTLQLVFDECINTYMDEYYMNFLKIVYPEEYEMIMSSSNNSEENIVLSDGTTSE